VCTAAAAVFAAAGCAAATQLQEPVAPLAVAFPPTSPIPSIVETPPLDQVQWGILAVDAGSGRVLVERNPATKFIPASNVKLPVAAAALHYLGPEHRFVTELRAAGTLDPATGVLTGDLVLSGVGDPTWSGRFHEDDQAPLRGVAASLLAAGVRSVSGRLVVDASGWDSATAVASWMVEDLPDAATGGAFVLAEGVTTVIVRGAAAPGQPATVSWTPYGEEQFVVSRVETVASLPPGAFAARIRGSYLPESRRLVIDGAIPVGRVDTLRLGTRDPVRQAAAALARALEAGGVAVHGGWTVAWDPGEPLAAGCAAGLLDACGAPTLARVVSPPLLDVVEVVLGPSHNWMAEQLLRALGPRAPLGPPAPGAPVATQPPRAGWPSGLVALRRYMIDAVGVDSLDLLLRDGSGLSAQNVLTPRSLVRLLEQVARTPWGEGFRLALPEPREAGTTLVNRLPGLEGRMFAKTGTLTNVVALSGYLVRTDGTLVIFSVLTNASGLPASRVQAGVDEIVRALAAEGGAGGG